MFSWPFLLYVLVISRETFVLSTSGLDSSPSLIFFPAAGFSCLFRFRPEFSPLRSNRAAIRLADHRLQRSQGGMTDGVAGSWNTSLLREAHPARSAYAAKALPAGVMPCFLSD
jgi:hypothetical protein